MKKRLLHNIYIVMLVALGLGAQEVSAMGSWRDVTQANRVWSRPSASGAFVGSSMPSRGFSSVVKPSVSPMSSSMSSMVGSPAVSAAEVGYDPLYNPSYRLSPSLFIPTRKTFETYAPTKETFYPSNIWSRIKSGASGARSLYNQYMPTKEEAMQSARAFPGQAYGVAQRGLAYPGRAVMATPGAIGSAGSWFGSKLRDAWSYAPQTAQDYAGRASKAFSENAYAPTAKAFSENVWNPASQFVSTNIAQPLSETSAAKLLAGMTEEQKQAAVGLAAVIAAGLVAKKGYDYLRGPSTSYSQFKQAIDEEVNALLIAYVNNGTMERRKDLLTTIKNLVKLIDNRKRDKGLSEYEANSLLDDLRSVQLQLDEIDAINDQIAALSYNYQNKKFSEYSDPADTLYQNIIGQSPILTAQQKQLLESKVSYLSSLYVVENALKSKDIDEINSVLKSIREKQGYFANISENQQNLLIVMLEQALQSK